MKKFNVLSIVFLMFSLVACDEGSKDNVASNVAIKEVNNATTASDVPEIKVLGWGPQKTIVGKLVNKQPNGETALWFQMEGKIKQGTELESWFGDTQLQNVVLNSQMGASSYLPSKLLDKEGDYPIYLVHAPSKKRFDIGVFSVKPVPSAEVTPAPLAVTSPEINTTTKKISKPKVIKSQ
jgi:hypothetical protein